MNGIDTLDLPDDVGELDESMQVGGAIRLPITAPLFRFVNGNSHLQPLNNFQYFGGWATDTLPLEAAMAEFAEAKPPTGMALAEIQADRKMVQVYSSRSILVAPFGVRESWFSKNKNTGSIVRSVSYFDGARRHVQAIVYLGHRPDRDGPIRPWGTVMLVAKGRQASNLLDAFSRWAELTKSARSRLSPNAPAWVFYLAIGSFGTSPVFKEVGKGSDTSVITPIQLFEPQTISDELVKSLYVGRAVADGMIQIRKKCQTWLDAWKNRTAEGYYPPAGSQAVRQNQPPPPPNWEDDEDDKIPF